MITKQHFLKIVIILIVCLMAGQAKSQECGEFALNDARNYYKTGNFIRTILRLDECLENGFDQNQKIQAYKILTLTYLAIDSTNEAREYATRLLQLMPNFEPDLFDPYYFTEYIKTIRSTKMAKTVVSVSKSSESLDEAPATVIVITSEDIKERGYTNLEALFSDIPGFDISRTRAATYSNLYQRGYRSNNTDRTLILVDGVEENELWSNAAFYNMQYPISNVKRIEVVYGPASTMYGANALVGVINIITKNADEILKDKAFAINAQTGYGSYNTRYLDVNVATKIKKIKISAAVRRFQSNDMDLSAYPEFNYDPADYDLTDYSFLNVTSNVGEFLQQDQNHYFDLQVNGTDSTAVLNQSGLNKVRELDKAAIQKNLNGHKIEYTNISDHYYLYGKAQIEDLTLGYELWTSIVGGTNYFNDNKQAGAANGSTWNPRQGFYYVKYQKDLNNIQLTNFTQYRFSSADSGSKSISLYNYSNHALGASDLITNRNPYWVSIYLYQLSRQFRNELKLKFPLGNSVNIISGFEVRQSSIQGDYRVLAYPDFVTSRPDTMPNVIEAGKSSMDNLPGGNIFNIFDFGTFLQGKWNIIDHLQLTFGGRYDYNKIRLNDGFKNQFNPRFALVYLPSKFAFKLIYAQAFQNASNWTKYSTAANRLVSNPDLAPEKVKNLEFSAAYNLNENAYIDFCFYNSNYTGVTGTREVQMSDGTVTSMNDAIGALHIQGLASNIFYKFNNYSFYLNYTFTNPQEYIPDPLTGEPTDQTRRIGDISSHKINAGANALFFDHLNINLRYNFIGKRETGPGTSVSLNPGTFPSISLLNAAISYFNIVKGIDLGFNINNILDKEYFDPGIRLADGNVYAYRTPQFRRNYLLHLDISF